MGESDVASDKDPRYFPVTFLHDSKILPRGVFLIEIVIVLRCMCSVLVSDHSSFTPLFAYSSSPHIVHLLLLTKNLLLHEER